MKLGHFYVQRACSPTRAALLTGRYSIRYPNPTLTLTLTLMLTLTLILTLTLMLTLTLTLALTRYNIRYGFQSGVLTGRRHPQTLGP